MGVNSTLDLCWRIEDNDGMSDPKEALKHQIEGLMGQYYENYYRKDLSLKDWRERIKNRLDEERTFAEPHLRKIEDWMGLDFAGQRVLVVGAGTGAESVVLSQRGAEVHGIEPSEKGVEILQLKADLHDLPRERFQQGWAENIAYPDESFDFVYCYTVIEHVADIERSIDEMLRVCKVGGTVYIQTLDFRFPYEPHYKMTRLPFSPRWMASLQLIFSGRSAAFLQTVKMVTSPQLDRILLGRNAITIRVNPPWLLDWEAAGLRNHFYYRFTKRFGIARDQYIFLKKLPLRAINRG
jgi:ubiquinone/menaquinone biosynthesis C-methylase UbiE